MIRILELKDDVLNRIREKQDEVSADTKIAGTDYQFLYFLKYLLELKPGEEVGFEVEDDIHVKKKDGKVILIQVKHTVQKNSNDEPKNLTDKSIDLWKTISNWVDLLYVEGLDQKEFLEKYSFILVTNKSVELSSLPYFFTKKDSDIKNKINEIYKKTDSELIKKYINKLLNLKDEIFYGFIEKLRIDYGKDDVCNEILESIRYRLIGAEEHIDETFERLLGKLNKDKYLIIKDKEKLSISYEDFTQVYKYCFVRGGLDRKLPKRKIEYEFPENLEEQIFIKQLIDIGDVYRNSIDIQKYTTLMLTFHNRILDWLKNQDILPLEFDRIKDVSIDKWSDEFKYKYRDIAKKIKAGGILDDLNEEINDLALDILYELRKFHIKIDNIELFDKDLSNGCYYFLTNKSLLGWHYSWKDKY